MEHLSEAEEKDVNVIKLNNFKQSRNEVPHDVAHPASKNYPEYLDDPISDLLGEFDDLVEEQPPREDFIYNHQKEWDYRVDYRDDLMTMVDKVGQQVKRIKEDTKRLRYYLDELDNGVED